MAAGSSEKAQKRWCSDVRERDGRAWHDLDSCPGNPVPHPWARSGLRVGGGGNLIGDV